MKLTAPADLYLVALGDHVAKGETVEVDDVTGESLLAQGWQAAGRAKPAPAKPRKRAAAKTPAPAPAPVADEADATDEPAGSDPEEK